MQHRGEIVKKAIQLSGYSITKLSEKLGRSRRWMYQVFENSTVSLDLILEIGKIIHYDFSGDIKELKHLKNKPFIAADRQENYYTKKEETAEYWKNKYLQLLEEHNALLKRS